MRRENALGCDELAWRPMTDKELAVIKGLRRECHPQSGFNAALDWFEIQKNGASTQDKIAAEVGDDCFVEMLDKQLELSEGVSPYFGAPPAR